MKDLFNKIFSETNFYDTLIVTFGIKAEFSQFFQKQSKTLSIQRLSKSNMRSMFSMLIIGFEAFFVSHDHKQATAPKTEEDHSGKITGKFF